VARQLIHFLYGILVSGVTDTHYWADPALIKTKLYIQRTTIKIDLS
jgi:hypothetical protein